MANYKPNIYDPNVNPLLKKSNERIDSIIEFLKVLVSFLLQKKIFSI